MNSRSSYEAEQVAELQRYARRLAELLALALQGSLLVRHAPPEVADAHRFRCHNRTPTTADLMWF